LKRRLLIVEDNPPSQELLCDWLESLGYETIAAGDLTGAQSALESQRVDAILLDLQLGEKDGLTLVEWVRAQPELRNLPVIVVTANAFKAEQERVRQAGCSGYLSKPVNFPELERQINRCFTHMKARVAKQ
jgi:two-component system cell cycle response regulator DivK